MNGEHVSNIFQKAFKDIEPDENGMSITTIRAPRSHPKPSAETYRRVSDMDNFEVRHSMMPGDGLFAPLSFVCFQSEYAKWKYAVAHPDLYNKEYITSCQNKLRVCSSRVSSSSLPKSEQVLVSGSGQTKVCSSEVVASSSSRTSALASKPALVPRSQKSRPALSPQGPPATISDDLCNEPFGEPQKPSTSDQNTPASQNQSTCNEAHLET